MIEISATRPTMGNRFPRIAAMLAVFAVLAGCGGGGGGPPPADPVTEYRALPPGVPMDAYHWADTFSPGSPVMAFGDVLHVGSDVAPPADALAPSGTRGGAALSRGHVRDGVGGEDVAEWVRLAAMHNLSDRSVTGLATYGGSRPAIVTLVRGPETRNRFTRFARLTQDAVAILNTGLPFEDRLRFNRYLHPGNAFPRMIGEIRVRFIPKTDPLYPEGADPGELGRTRVSYYAKDGTAAVHEVSGDGASYSDVLVDPEAVGPLSDPEATHVLVHELLHAVGFVSHTDPARFASTLSDVGFYPGTQPRSLIHPIDREGLLAAYGRFEPGDGAGRYFRREPGSVGRDVVPPARRHRDRLRRDRLRGGVPQRTRAALGLRAEAGDDPLRQPGAVGNGDLERGAGGRHAIWEWGRRGYRALPRHGRLPRPDRVHRPALRGRRDLG